MTRSTTNSKVRRRLDIRSVHADRVHAAMLAHADEIQDVRDVLRLDALRGLRGECAAVAVADLAARGRVIGASGAGRIRAVDPGRLFA